MSKNIGGRQRKNLTDNTFTSILYICPINEFLIEVEKTYCWYCDCRGKNSFESSVDLTWTFVHLIKYRNTINPHLIANFDFFKSPLNHCFKYVYND